MTHWGWYWRVKKKHKSKALCSQFTCLDSFQFFKQKGVSGLSVSNDKYAVQAMLEGGKFSVTGSHNYEITIEKLPCRFGGFCYYLHCPHCKVRMRKLYCCHGMFLCRKCLKLGYYTQRLTPCLRYGHMQVKVETKLKRLGGDPWQNLSGCEKTPLRSCEVFIGNIGASMMKPLRKKLGKCLGVRLRGCFGCWLLVLIVQNPKEIVL